MSPSQARVTHESPSRLRTLAASSPKVSLIRRTRPRSSVPKTGCPPTAVAASASAWALARRASAARRLDSPTRSPTTKETNRKANSEKRLSASLMVHDLNGGVKNQLARKNPEIAVTAAGRAPPRTPAPTAARR